MFGCIELLFVIDFINCCFFLVDFVVVLVDVVVDFVIDLDCV